MQAKLFTNDIMDLCGLSQQTLSLKLKKFHFKPKSGRKKYQWLNWYEAKDFLNPSILPEKKFLSFYSPKGGIGKTTLAREIGIRANTYGLKVLLVDMDFNETLTQSLIEYRKTNCFYSILKSKKTISEIKINISPGLDLIPSEFGNGFIDEFLIKIDYENIFHEILDAFVVPYDLVIFDSPPNIGKGTRLLNKYAKNLIIPVVPELFSLNAMPNILDSLNYENNEVPNSFNTKLVVNKVDFRISSNCELSLKISDTPWKDLLLKNRINTDQFLSNVRNNYESIFSFNPTKVCQKQISALTNEILDIKYEIKK